MRARITVDLPHCCYRTPRFLPTHPRVRVPHVARRLVTLRGVPSAGVLAHAALQLLPSHHVSPWLFFPLLPARWHYHLPLPPPPTICTVPVPTGTGHFAFDQLILVRRLLRLCARTVCCVPHYCYCLVQFLITVCHCIAVIPLLPFAHTGRVYLTFFTVALWDIRIGRPSVGPYPLPYLILLPRTVDCSGVAGCPQIRCYCCRAAFPLIGCSPRPLPLACYLVAFHARRWITAYHVAPDYRLYLVIYSAGLMYPTAYPFLPHTPPVLYILHCPSPLPLIVCCSICHLYYLPARP